MSNIQTYRVNHTIQMLSVLQHPDSTDYLLGGSLVMKNGKIDKVLFEGGYAQASVASATTDKFAFNFYNQDHLGNNREVVDAKGVVQQVTNYYPFGAPYADATAVKNANLQQYKYNGKELDLMHGLNTYDYGARQHDPILARWDRIDPLCETYYDSSPYVYCGNNPSNMVDYDGCDYWSTNDPEQIRALINALGSGQNQFDFSGWSHATDAEFGANLTYNDETHKFYTSYAEVKDGELVVTGKSFNADLTPVSSSGLGYEGAFVYKPITNPLLKIAYAFDPLTYYDGFTNWTCNTQGRITGVAPIMGMPPAVGFRGGKEFQKMGKAIGNMSGNRNVQKEQIESLASKHKLTKKERRILHDEVSHQGYGYHEIEDLINSLFGK